MCCRRNIDCSALDVVKSNFGAHGGFAEGAIRRLVELHTAVSGPLMSPNVRAEDRLGFLVKFDDCLELTMLYLDAPLIVRGGVVGHQ